MQVGISTSSLQNMFINTKIVNLHFALDYIFLAGRHCSTGSRALTKEAGDLHSATSSALTCHVTIAKSLSLSPLLPFIYFVCLDCKLLSTGTVLTM